MAMSSRLQDGEGRTSRSHRLCGFPAFPKCLNDNDPESVNFIRVETRYPSPSSSSLFVEAGEIIGSMYVDVDLFREYKQRSDHKLGSFVPYSLWIVCGFFNISC